MDLTGVMDSRNTEPDDIRLATRRKFQAALVAVVMNVMYQVYHEYQASPTSQ